MMVRFLEHMTYEADNTDFIYYEEEKSQWGILLIVFNFLERF